MIVNNNSTMYDMVLFFIQICVILHFKQTASNADNSDIIGRWFSQYQYSTKSNDFNNSGLNSIFNWAPFLNCIRGGLSIFGKHQVNISDCLMFLVLFRKWRNAGNVPVPRNMALCIKPPHLSKYTRLSQLLCLPAIQLSAEEGSQRPTTNLMRCCNRSQVLQLCNYTGLV